MTQRQRPWPPDSSSSRRRCSAACSTAQALLAMLLLASQAAAASSNPPPPTQRRSAQPTAASIASEAATLNYTTAAPAPAPADNVTTLLLSQISYNESEADAWYLKLAPTDEEGRQTLCYGIQRFSSANVSEDLSGVLKVLLAGLDDVLAAVQMTFVPRYAVLRQSSTGSSSSSSSSSSNSGDVGGTPANGTAGSNSTNGAASNPLDAFRAVDVYFSLSLQKDARLRAPLNADLLDLLTTFLNSKLQQAGFSNVGSTFVDLAFPAGFANVQAEFVKETFFSRLKVTGAGILPFTVEKQTLLLTALDRTFQAASLSARTQAIVPGIFINPAESVFEGSGQIPAAAAEAPAAALAAIDPAVTTASAVMQASPGRRRRGRRLMQTASRPPPAAAVPPSQEPAPPTQEAAVAAAPGPPAPKPAAVAAVQELEIIVRCRMYPVQLVSVVELWERSLSGSTFAVAAAQLGLPLQMQFLNATIDTTKVPMAGPTVVTLTYESAGGSETGGASLQQAAGRSRHKGLSSGGIAGVVIACIAFVALLIAGIAYAALRKRRDQRQRTSSGGGGDKSTPPSLSSNSNGSSFTAAAHNGAWPGGKGREGSPPASTRYSHSPSSNGSAGAITAITANGNAPAPSSRAGSCGDSVAASSIASSAVGSMGGVGLFGTGLPGSLRSPSATGAGYLGSQEIDMLEIEFCVHPDDGQLWLLGRGSFGQVYKALRRGVQEVAVKKLEARIDPLWLRMLHKEIAILSKVSYDRNIVQFYGACLTDPESPMLVMEYMAGGDLRQAFMADESGAFAWDARGRGVALDIARGLHFLHSSGVVHRDLKTSNVLLTAEGVAKIGDVGLAKILADNEQHSLDQAAGTFSFAAPELILGLRCSEKADIYSFGVVLWEICTKELPRRGQLRDVLVPSEAPAEIAALIDDCLQPSPAKRPTAAELFRRITATTPGADAASYSPFQSRFSSATC